MKIKILPPILCLLFLIGCGQKEKTQQTKDYAADTVSGIHIQNDSAHLTISASSDDKIHVSVKGTAAENGTGTSVGLNDGILKIVQTDSAKNALEQFSFGKKDQIALSLPAAMRCPVSLKNNSGDMEIHKISASDFQLDNASGYGKFTDITADAAEIDSDSGDIQISDSEILDINLQTASGYVTLENPTSGNIQIATKSGEANLSQLNTDTNLDVSTDSGDIDIAYKSVPDSLDFQIVSGSKDITAKLGDALYETDKADCKKGSIGAGACRLTVKSGTGAVIIQ